MGFFRLTPLEWEAFKLSLWVAFWAVSASLPIGIFTAWVLSRCRFPGKGVLDGLIHLPLVLPPVVTGYLLLILFGRKGIVGKFLYDTLGITIAFTWKGAALASAVMAFPLLVRAVRLSVDAVDQGLEDAARTLGAGRPRVFFTINLPLMVPGIITGIILAFARSLGEFGATITFVSNIQGETQTLPLALYSLTQVPNGEGGALRLCAIAVILAMAALLISEWMSRRFAAYMKG
ncbi:MAG TPA: molybdate ABC transporter permease subunit [Desulfobacterales bacterium]|mgnify:CR=1 FL=1|nr:molybdate ABC transporter permease subunit [Desulfobacterales bacterium]